MYDHHLTEMALVVAVALKRGPGLLAAEEATAVIREALAGYWADKMAIVWSVLDVQMECPRLTEVQAAEVLALVSRRRSANAGVNLDTFHDAASELFGHDAADSPLPTEGEQP